MTTPIEPAKTGMVTEAMLQAFREAIHWNNVLSNAEITKALTAALSAQTAPAEVVVINGSPIAEFVQSYQWDGDEGTYTPSFHERVMIEDAICGYLSEHSTPTQAEAKEKLGRFGHHPDPANDFCIEVEAIEGLHFNALHGISKPGTTPPTMEDVHERIERAMDFTVGGDEIAVKAKQTLRALAFGQAEAKEAGILWSRDTVCRAAEKANERYGQFMPQQWIDFFMQEYERASK